MAEIVGMVGVECEDIALYLARVLVLMEKRVAVCDRTEQKLLVQMLRGTIRNNMAEKEEDFISEGICIKSEAADYDAFDFVIILFGFRVQHPKLYECQKLFLISDGLPAHAYLLQRIKQWERKQYLILRNMVPVKYSETYIQTILQMKDVTVFEIPMAEADVRSRYQIGVDEKLCLKRLSGGMKNVIGHLAESLLLQVNEKQIRQIIKIN